MRLNAAVFGVVLGCRESPTPAASDAASTATAPFVALASASPSAPRLFAQDASGHWLAPESREELRAWIAGATALELYALGANRWRGPGRDDRPRFYDFPKLGSAPVDDAESRRALADAWAKDAEPTPVGGAWCFEPRHAIRARRGDEVIDIVICYQCREQAILAEGVTAASPDAGFRTWKLHPINHDSYSLLDRLLREKGVEPEHPEPLPGATKVEVRRGTLVEEKRIAVLHLMNHVVSTCYDSSQLFRPHAGGDVELDLRLARGRDSGSDLPPASVKLVRDTAPPGFARCMVREALKVTFDPLPEGVDLRVRYAVEAFN
jgi:hypothetical protein